MATAFFDEQFREFIAHPIALSLGILCSCLIAFILFGIHIESENGVVTAVRIAGETLDNPSAGLVVRELIRTVAGLFTGALIFLSILQCASVYAEGVTHPLLGVTLAAGVSRIQWVGLRHAAFLAVQGTLIGGTSAAVGLILSLRTGIPLWSRFVQASACAMLEVFSLLLIGSLLATLVRHSVLVAVVLLAYQWYLSPMLSAFFATHHLVLSIDWFLPPVGRMHDGMTTILAGGRYDLWEILRPVPMLLTAYGIVFLHFKHEDLT